MKKSDDIPEFVYTSSDYNKYLIQYEGDIELDLKGVPGLYVSKLMINMLFLQLKILI